MIIVSAFVSDTLNTVDGVISHFVSSAYTQLIQSNLTVITLVFTLYVMLLGYRFLHHDHHFNLSHIMRHLIVMLCVYGLLINWTLYNLFIYNIFTNEPGVIAKTLIESSGQGTTTIAEALDGIYAAVIHATMGLWSQIGFSPSSLAFIIYGLIVFIIGTVLCIFALLLFIYAKMMMAVALALGPLFIICILFEATKPLFSAWLTKLITLALIPIVTSAILVLMLSVINVTLHTITQPAEALQFYGMAPFLGLTLLTTLILSQVFRICSTLGGGITLASLSQGKDIAKKSLEASGISAASRKAANWAKKKMTKGKTNLFKDS